LPNVIRTSSIESDKLSAFATLRFARITSVLPAAANSKLIPLLP